MSRPFKGVIPNRFVAGGIEYDVLNVTNEFNEDNFGRVDLFEAKVKLQTMCNNTNVSKSQMCQTFWHEVVHIVLESIGEKVGEENERFTTAFSSVLNEIIQSCEVDDQQMSN